MILGLKQLGELPHRASTRIRIAHAVWISRGSCNGLLPTRVCGKLFNGRMRLIIPALAQLLRYSNRFCSIVLVAGLFIQPGQLIVNAAIPIACQSLFVFRDGRWNSVRCRINLSEKNVKSRHQVWIEFLASGEIRLGLFKLMSLH